MTTYRRNAANPLAGFTLVEILVVIVIIGLLAGMTTTVVVSARRSVNNSVITAQMSQLSIALDEYKNKFGEYPPDLSDQVAVERHLKKRWPRYVVAYDDFLKHIELGCKLSSGDYRDITPTLADLDERGRHVWDVRAYISPLVFWLGGLPDENGVPSGFYASPTCPLGIKKDGSVAVRRTDRAKKEKPFYSFDRKYLGAYESNDKGGRHYYKVASVSELNGWEEGNPFIYTPAYCQGDYPIVYFRPSVNMPYETKSFFLTHSSDANDAPSYAVPYAQNVAQNVNSWYEDKRFQLVHPGDDGLFGTVDPALIRVVPDKSNISLEDADNLTNFLEGGTLESLYD